MKFIMINRLLSERLTKNEYLTYQALVALVAIWIFYCRFYQSGPVDWLDTVQARYLLDGDYYPVLSLVVGLALFLIPISGLPGHQNRHCDLAQLGDGDAGFWF